MEQKTSLLPGVISSARAGLITMKSHFEPIPFTDLLSLCNIPNNSDDQRRVIITSMGGQDNQPVSFSGSFVEDGRYFPRRVAHFEVEYTTNPRLSLYQRTKKRLQDPCYWMREWEDGKKPYKTDWEKLE